MIDHLQRFLHWDRDDAPETRLDKLEQALRTSRLPLADVVPLFAALLSVPLCERYPPLRLPPQEQRYKTQEALVAWLCEEAERQPVLAVWEDLHWADPSTLDFLNLVLEQVPTARLLTLLTCRPEFRPPWATRSYQMQVTLGRLGRPQVAAMLSSLTGGKPLPADVVEQVLARTDGVPLFVEELVKMILESGLVREEGDHYVLTGLLPPLAIPSTLHDSLMARLDRLSTARQLVQLGAVLGREFSYELLQAVAPVDETTLQQGMAQLVDAELVYQRGLPPRSRYVFKHALIQEAAYQSLLKSTRQQYHQRIAQALAERFPDIAETQPELLAQHYTEAGLAQQATDYWQQAGQRASGRSAYVEAITHCTKGLEVLTTLPETTERAHHELMLHFAMAPALNAIKGYAAPEVERAYVRARELCQQVGETRQLLPVLWGLRTCYSTQGKLQMARTLGEEALHLAQCVDDPVLLLRGQVAHGQTLLCLGEVVAAHAHLTQGRGLYTAQHLSALRIFLDPGTSGLVFLPLTLWLLGYPDQALRSSHAILSLSRERLQPYSIAWGQFFTAWLHQLRREGHAVEAQAEAATAVCLQQGFPLWGAGATVLRGWALAVQGQQEAGLDQIQQGLAAWRATGVALHLPYLLALHTEILTQAGQTDAGLRAITEALTLVDNHGERYWEAELLRLKGEYLLVQAGQGQQAKGEKHHWLEVETLFQQALAVARQQQAKSLELRVALSLSRLWQLQGKQPDARKLLAEIYGWFTEGFATADLQEARTLLEALT